MTSRPIVPPARPAGFSLCAGRCLIGILIAAASMVWAPHANGELGAGETFCDDLSGPARGLCEAYCESMDCDGPAPNASPNACSRVEANFLKHHDQPIPCGFLHCGAADVDPDLVYDLDTVPAGVHLSSHEIAPGRQVHVHIDFEVSSDGAILRVREDRCIDGVQDRFLYEIVFSEVVEFIDTGPEGYDLGDEVVSRSILGESPYAWGEVRSRFGRGAARLQLTSSVSTATPLLRMTGRMNTESFQVAPLSWGANDIKFDYTFTPPPSGGSSMGLIGTLKIDHRTTDPANPDPRLLPCYVDCNSHFRRLETLEAVDIPGHFRDVHTFSVMSVEGDGDCLWD